MRCVYCYNPEIVRGKGNMRFEQALELLQTRKGLLDAVVLSGGECLMHAHIDLFLNQIRDLGFCVKIDTNGSNPLRLKALIQKGLVDYVALDFKALKAQYYSLTQSDLFVKFENSLDLLLAADIQFEVRTTYHSSLIQTEQMVQMIQYLEAKNYSGVYYLQNFFNDCQTLGLLENDYQKLRQGQFRSERFRIEVRN